MAGFSSLAWSRRVTDTCCAALWVLGLGECLLAWLA